MRPALALLVLLAACGGDAGEAGGDQLTGQVLIDGSSTVFPVAEALAEEFQIAHPGVQVSVGISGSGGGFQRFCAGEIDISNASRPIREGEVQDCEANGIEFDTTREEIERAVCTELTAVEPYVFAWVGARQSAMRSFEPSR